MKEKITSILKWRFDFPSIIELRAIERIFNKKERFIFLAAFVMLGAAFIGILWEVNAYLSVNVPANGGKWREGILGSPNLVNPLIALTDADRDLTAVIYSGLMRADGKGRLVPDLAKNYEISEDGLKYTFILKEDLKWHDNKDLTAEDVIFTVQTAKNAALKSPIRANWEGVEAEAVNERELVFTLQKPYAPFLENTTLGILPKHIWENVAIEQFPLSNFNYNPVGSGPYKIKSTERNSSGIITAYTLERSKNYANKEPYIKIIEFKFYSSEKSLKGAFEENEIDAMSIVSLNTLNSLQRKNTTINKLTLPRVFGVFLNQNRIKAFTETSVREALKLSVDPQKIIDDVLGGYGEKISSPIPPGTFGAIENDNEQTNEDGVVLAEEKLKKAGWKYDEEKQVLVKKTNKESQELRFSLATVNTPDLINTAKLLLEMWGRLGIVAEVKIFELNDLNQVIIRPREYDALLFGEVVGRDPDPFAFWHSSQRNDPGLNIALYTNTSVDKLLEDARRDINEENRREKYEKFQKEVISETPAIFLYSPQYLYVTANNLKGFETENITIPSERFSRINEWYLVTQNVLKYFVD